MSAHHTEIIEHAGRQFRVTLHPDDSSDAPWDGEDGHGPVRALRHRESINRGEMLLYKDRGNRWAYDFGSAIVTAARDGWGISAEVRATLTRRLGKKPTRSQERAESVRQDMAHLAGYLSGDWCYLGVCVVLLDADGEPSDDDGDASLWGVESSGDYWREIAQDLATEILHDRSMAWRAALTERRAVRHWASRDVQTVGA